LRGFFWVTIKIGSRIPRRVRVEFFHHPRGIPRYHHIRGDVFSDHRARCDHAVIANRDTLQHGGMVTHPYIVTKPDGGGRLVPVDTVVQPMPVRVGNVGAIGEHATVAQHDLVAGADARARAHKACIAERNAPFSDPATPYTDLHTLTDGIDRGKRVANRYVGARDVHIPGRHDGGVHSQMCTARPDKPVDPGRAKRNIKLFDPKRAKIFAHDVSVHRTRTDCAL